MIHAVLIFNTSGIPRLTKFYTPLHQSSQTVIQKIFSLISVRPAGLCNFLDAPELEAFLGAKDDSDERWRVVYRNYATLYFVFVVDGAESELGILDLIQVLVEALDRAFENVCELDLVFHFDEVLITSWRRLYKVALSWKQMSTRSATQRSWHRREEKTLSCQQTLWL